MQKIISLEYQLGGFVGDKVSNSLPLLAADGFSGKTAIYATIGEADELKRLSDDWFDHGGGVNERWNKLQSFRKELIKKYLPHTFEGYVLPKIHYTENFNMSDFKKGIKDALWDSDVCYYKIENENDIEISEDEWFTKITLKLDIK